MNQHTPPKTRLAKAARALANAIRMTRGPVIDIQANAATDGELVTFSAPVTFTAATAAADGKPAGPAKFAMTAYTGGELNVGFSAPVVVELSGISGIDGTRPALRDHEFSQVVGHATKMQVVNGALVAEGVISGAGDAAKEVVAAAQNGFPWQASIGAKIVERRFVASGETTNVNGRTFKGPLIVATRSRIAEISFVALGADENTSARIAASSPQGASMTFEQWLKAKGFDAATLNETQRASLKAIFDAENTSATQRNSGGEGGTTTSTSGNAGATANAGGTTTQQNASASAGTAGTIQATGAGAQSGGPLDPVAAFRAQQAAETERVAVIRATCNGKHADLEAKAIREGWDKNKIELEVLKASSPTAPAGHVRGNDITPNVLACALLTASGVKNLDKSFDAPTMQAAHTRYRGRLGLSQFILEAAAANGYSGSLFSAMSSDTGGVLEAAFSTADVTNILSNVANKTLLEAYESEETAWREITAFKNVKDFKQATSYRLTTSGRFEKVGPAGEIVHGTIGDQKFTNQADEYGILFAITRKMLVNDDLQAFNDMVSEIGRLAGLTLNEVFWTAFMNNATFFASGNNNYISGATTVLGIDGLSSAVATLDAIVDAQNKPITVNANKLLVPPGLKPIADQLYNSTEMRDTTANTKSLTQNPHAQKYRPIKSRWLANTTITGNSTTAWYLLGDRPPVIATSFLNGVQAPTIESAAADFSTSGIKLKGVFDFGVDLQDYRGGVKSKGAA